MGMQKLPLDDEPKMHSMAAFYEKYVKTSLGE